MKINRHGKAKVLLETEINALGAILPCPYKQIFYTGIYTGARIQELVTLKRLDNIGYDGKLKEIITFRKENVKGKIATRQIPTHPKLLEVFQDYYIAEGIWLFPATTNKFAHVHRDTFAKKLSWACRKLGIVGASTHSMRRTALTKLYLQGIDLKVLQKISGHVRLDQLSRYLEVPEHLVKEAIYQI